MSPTQGKIVQLLKDHSEGFTAAQLMERLELTSERAVMTQISKLRKSGVAIQSPRYSIPSGPRTGVEQKYTL